jgi:NTE family protein
VRLSRKYLADYHVGQIDAPQIPLAAAVGASSAFPPVLSPVIIETQPSAWKKVDGADLFDDSAYREKLVLTDGGVYDNMGLEAIWDRCKTVLVSDAGAPFDADPSPKTAWTSQLMRVLDIVTEQTRALRRKMLIGEFEQKNKLGTYWGIKTRIADYGLQDTLMKDSELTASLQNVRTRLNPFTDEEQGRLINWGYALADAAMRRHVLAGTPVAAGSLPFPQFVR